MKNTSIVLRAFLFVLMIPLSFNQVKATPLSVKITSQTNVQGCNGGSNGSATATATGGTSPYNYVWSTTPTQSGATVITLTAGTYTVTVTDALSNTASTSVTITQPSVLTATTSSTNNTSCVNPNGTATVVASGGIAPYAYFWAPIQKVSTTVSNLPPGTYTTVVADATGCSTTATATVGGTAAPLVAVFATPSCLSPCTGTVAASVSGGAPPYTYLWSNGVTVTNASGLCPAYYTCNVTDNAGCRDSAGASVAVNCSCFNSYNQPICIVTLDTATNKCEIIWGRTNSPPSGGYGQFNIYRNINNVPVLVHSQPLNVLSEYIDPNSNPSAGPVTYEITTVDSCGESALSPSHTSIYLTTAAGHNSYILNWTPYGGFTPIQYRIYRGPSLSKLKAIDSVASNILTYTDNNPPIGSYYVVEAESPNGPCIATTHGPGKSSISLLSGGFSNGFNTGTLLGVTTLDNNITNLNVYPNPSNGVFTLNYTIDGNDNVSITIINELGQEVYTEQKGINNGPHTEQLNLENLASGIYTLHVQTNAGLSVRKLLIMGNR